MPRPIVRGRLACLPLILLVAIELAAINAQAGQTRSWQQADFADFEKGVLKNLSLRSDGQLSLAPEFTERLDSSSAYLWAVAQDSKGNLYTGGGPGAKLYRVTASGDSKVIAELDELNIQAIAIDRKDQVFVATSPDGKVYKLNAAGKPEVFYDPKAKYIWALVFDSKGALFVGTGDQGIIHKVAADGKGAASFRTDETHARALAIDGKDNLIVGTDPGGLVVRVSPSGDGFVLHQLSKKEVTAVAVAPDGSIYAAAVGTKQAGSSASPGLSIPPPPAAAPAAPGAQQRPQAPAAPVVPPPAPITGGSEIVRIYPDGYPRKVWSHAQDIVYTLGFDSQGRALAGAGNKGSIYRLDSDTLHTALVNAAPTQVTAICSGRDGKIFATTGNSGKLYQLGPGLEKEGSIESDVLDAGLFSTWGRLSFEGDANGGRFAVTTRSGNLDRPQKNWSDWSPAIASKEGERVASPPARFLQWKGTLTAGSGGQSPVLKLVDVAYLPKNVAPRVEAIEGTPANYRFPAPSSAPGAPPQTLTLPAMGRPARSGASSGDSVTPAMQYAKGAIGIRWTASDDNQDPLIHTIQIRGINEREWKLFKEGIRERYYSWDSTAFPDGDYILRVTASDSPGNPKPDALSGSLDSDPLLIDNTPPRISGLTASRNGTRLIATWKASDALNIVEKAEYSLDGGEWQVVAPKSKVSDSKDLDYELTIDAVGAGEHTLAVRVQDEYANQVTEKVIAR